MRRFSCSNCGNELHFENTVCLVCGNATGYNLKVEAMLSTPPQSVIWQAPTGPYSACANRQLIGCNWLVEGEFVETCLSCRHTQIIPDLSAPENVERWAKLESAKRVLFYSLLKFQLPLAAIGAPSGQPLSFELKADELSSDGRKAHVTAGHDNGRITINIAESDDAIREKHRVSMGEPYRTLIGHFRHEIGHYYWDRLVAANGDRSGFRHVFGDEREDYESALQRHYALGPPLNWPVNFVSAYASAHPWEDFAETWAHYFHMVDGLETAESYGIGSSADAGTGPERGSYQEIDFDALLKTWIPLTVAMNAMNRSIGNHDFYPFVLSHEVSKKLKFVHDLIHKQSAPAATSGG